MGGDKCTEKPLGLCVRGFGSSWVGFIFEDDLFLVSLFLAWPNPKTENVVVFLALGIVCVIVYLSVLLCHISLRTTLCSPVSVVWGKAWQKLGVA